MNAPTLPAHDARPLNAITVDFEDWALDYHQPISDRLRPSVQKVLELLASHAVQATFFVLGCHAEQAPDLLREIQQAGHEIQCHGYGHQLIHRQTPGEFRSDVSRAKKLIEDITGCEITGYRAPAFTVTRQTLWAVDILVELGFQYDSSVFPVLTKRYGIPDAPRHPHVLYTPAGGQIKELPLASYCFAGRRIPVGGGGYFRLLPHFVLRRGIRQLNATGHAATIYMHPYEYDPTQFRTWHGSVPWGYRLRQGLWRRYFPGRVRRLLTEFRFGPARDVIAELENWPIHQYHPGAVGCR